MEATRTVQIERSEALACIRTVQTMPLHIACHTVAATIQSRNGATVVDYTIRIAGTTTRVIIDRKSIKTASFKQQHDQERCLSTGIEIVHWCRVCMTKTMAMDAPLWTQSNMVGNSR